MRDNLPVNYAAVLYDTYTTESVRPWDDALIQRMVEEFKPRFAQGILLDIGTGTAQLLVKVAQAPALRSLRFIGMDLFEDMVAEARQTVQEAGMEDRIEIHAMDAHTLTYPDNYASMVMSRSTIHHWADPPQVFRQIYRVLVPGGVAIIHDIRRDPDPALLDAFNAVRIGLGIGPTDLSLKYTPDETRAMLQEAGLTAVSTVAAPDAGPGALGYEVRIKK
jgi:ubiquinone/menaquinone biosynthesis C-methylase UbiE